jgi:hypothetical protein
VSRLTITAPAAATILLPVSVTVTAFDAYNNVATGYRGTIQFRSFDRRATLPSKYSFIARDGGVHTFGNAVSLKSLGTQTITAYDVLNPTIVGSTSVNVSVAVAAGTDAIGGVDPLIAGQARVAIMPRDLSARARGADEVPRQPAPATAGSGVRVRQSALPFIRSTRRSQNNGPVTTRLVVTRTHDRRPRSGSPWERAGLRSQVAGSPAT